MRPCVVLIGDAAGLTLNTGLTIRGMDLAAGSALAAAAAINDAFVAGDFTGEALAEYPRILADSFVGKDLQLYAKAPDFFDSERLYKEYGVLLADVFNGIYGLDTTPRQHLYRVALDAFRNSPLRFKDVVHDAWRGLRSL
jgi:electron transfer flavoprotein-quinone oxidoreductase